MNFGICYACDHLDLCSHPSGNTMLFHCDNFRSFPQPIIENHQEPVRNGTGLCGACDEFSACTYPHETDHWFCEEWNSSE